MDHHLKSSSVADGETKISIGIMIVLCYGGGTYTHAETSNELWKRGYACIYIMFPSCILKVKILCLEKATNSK